MSYIDLHMHSYISDDGEFSPKELVDLCLEKKQKYFAIADHNSIKAIEEAMDYCLDKEIKIIPAIELDCTIGEVNLHVLGYGIDYKTSAFDKIEEDIIMQEQEASKKRMKLVRELGIDFSDEIIEKLSRNGVVNGEMIAEAAMLYDKDKKNPLLQPYYKNGSRSDNPYVNFYWDFCAKGKAAYAEVKYISLKEAIEVIEKSGGVPVLAHPGNNVKEDETLLEEIISQGIKGMEVYSSYHSKEQVEFYKNFAKKHNLFLTCGSDFHGKTKPSISIGGIDCEDNEENILSSLRKFIEID
ncbi:MULTISPECIES: PHP domain-containing protein [Eubacteriales]|uniref:Phosphatase n=1 Tax=Clostridium isatidis TaxID=182773 RepID=A0A343JCL4_9CLOT|nr:MULTISPECIES: PHP domain-containing protein [Eubacteriales]ASW43272.1 phosphatase [Clostridium isatidis]MBU5453835.1 PHP domain-containing protein [Caproiciproducens sp. MSJ-32]NLZ33822.1 PHP domain-containing protein [Clostridiales bacterium]